MVSAQSEPNFMALAKLLVAHSSARFVTRTITNAHVLSRV